MLLYGKPVVKKLLDETKQRVEKNWKKDSYVAFLLLSDDYPSRVYVRKKQRYANRCGMWSVCFHKPDASFQEVIASIEQYNSDDGCVGIVVQLPLAPHLRRYLPEILARVANKKDVDGLGWVMFGKSLTQVVNFLPATPKATYELLDYYALGDLRGKIVTMIGQSNLMWKPFVLEAMRRGATVITTNSTTADAFLYDACMRSEYIVSATWIVDLLTPEFFWRADLTWKIIIDVGYGIKDGKACGDTDREGLAELWATITPVPWGVWPITVASLFHNLIVLHASKHHL